MHGFNIGVCCRCNANFAVIPLCVPVFLLCICFFVYLRVELLRLAKRRLPLSYSQRCLHDTLLANGFLHIL